MTGSPTSTPPVRYRVPDMSCDHCESAITTEVLAVPGVETVTVDLTARTVDVLGGGRAGVIAAIDAAGYDVEEPEA